MKASFRQTFRYRFDNFMARGGASIFLSLLVVFGGALLLVSLLRGLILLVHPDGASFEGALRHLYVIFLQLTDPGNMSLDVQSSPVYKVSAILAGLLGMIIVSMLIAFITTALDQKLTQLKKGHSKVIEEEHTLIIGWSERVIEILRELILANESEDDPCVVILSGRDKETMDDELALHLPDTKNTRVVTRSGSTSSMVNLEVVSLATAKSVIVLAHCTDAASAEEKLVSDTRVIKTVLGVMASKAEDQELPVVAEIFNERNHDLARQISPSVTTVHALDILAKILVQTSRSIGLSVVYSEIMSFDGCELYLYNGDWHNLDFHTLAYHFPDGVPLGVRRADGSLLLNPPQGTQVNAEDEILILAEDDSTIEVRPAPVAKPRRFVPTGQRLQQRVEHELILGWSAKAPIIIRQYADYVLKGSSVSVLLPDPDDEVRHDIRNLQQELSDLEIRLIDQDPTQLDTLMEMQPFLYDNIIILSQAGEQGDPEAMDSTTIILLLLLRRAAVGARSNPAGTKLISEVMDSENQHLIANAGVNDFIISNRLVSMLLAQISENPVIYGVYDDLFQEDGSEIYLKPASLYFESFPVQVTFADLMAVAFERQEVCLGVKIHREEKDAERNYGVKLIPEKNTKYTFREDDCLIVLAEDET